MKKIYFCKLRALTAALIPLGFILMLSLTFSNVQGQSLTLTWKGTVSNDASTPENWDPAMDYNNQIIKVDTATHYPVPPRFTSKRNETFSGLVLSNRAEIYIAKPDTNTITFPVPTAGYFLAGIINLESGAFTASNNRNFYMDNKEAKVVVSGTGKFTVAGTTSIGNRSATAGNGGHIVIKDNGTYTTRDIIRFQNDVNFSTITITDKGIFAVRKDYRNDFANRIKSGQIHSDEDHDVIIDYNLLTTTTSLSVRPKDTLLAYPPEMKNVLAGEEPIQLFATINRGYQNLKNKQWKYTTTPGSGYKSFTPAVYGDTVKIFFPDPGTYYVVFQGTKEDNTVGTSNEIPVNVVATYSRIDLTGIQYLRPDQYGAKLTSVDQTAITSHEWKYSTTQGKGYVSFPEPQKGTEYIPHFTTAGLYYVVCEYVKGGQTYITKEVTINVAAHNFTINWLGTFSDDAHEIQNWSPMAQPAWMTLNIPANSTVWPTFYGSANDTIQSFTTGKVIVEKNAAARLRFNLQDFYLASELIVKSGIVNFRNARLDNGNAIINASGNSRIIIDNWLIMGNAATATNGGRINLTDNATLELSKTSNDVWRWVAGSDSLSIWYITDNARVIFPGNAFNLYMAAVESGKIKTAEGRRIAVFYNETDTITTIYSVSETAFNVADKSDIVVGVKKSIPELTVKNTTGIISYEWKYTTTSGSGYKSFVPAKTAAKMTAAFDTADIYYIICEGSDGIVKTISEQVKVTAVSVVITPGDRQALAVLTEGKTLKVKESVTADSREWKVSEKQGAEYIAIFPSVVDTMYTPLFLDNGIYYVVCESIVKGVSILSNEVKFVVGVTGVNDLEKSDFALFPNPAPGAFWVNESSQNYSLSIVDMAGRTVLLRNFTNVNGNQLIRFNGKGVYIVTVNTGETVKTKPVIIQ